MKLTKLERLPKPIDIKRVAAYTRVSTDKPEALSSLANQIAHYKAMFKKKPGYVLVGVFSDNGISGSKNDRPEFQKMLEMAKNGQIDVIYTKTISRFSRNLITTVEVIRELKAFNVGVYFEEQNMNTLDYKCELTLNLMSIFAESELRSMSGNMRWRIRKDFEEGKLWSSADCYGYKFINRRYEYDPETAPIVKRVFEMYLSGMGTYVIAKTLNNEQIPTIKGGKWNSTTINEMLTNRNVTGDLLLQKTFKKDYKTDTVKNRGQIDSFLVENDHKAIIDKDTFFKVQELIKQKATQFNTQEQKQKIIRLFTDLLYCGNCGHAYRFKKGLYQSHYHCALYMNSGKSACQSRGIREEVLIKVTKQVLNTEEIDRDFLQSKLTKIIAKNGNLLTFIFKNGKETTVQWDMPKRSETWTPEMKQRMRESSSKIVMVRGANGHFIKKGENLCLQ